MIKRNFFTHKGKKVKTFDVKIVEKPKTIFSKPPVQDNISTLAFADTNTSVEAISSLFSEQPTQKVYTSNATPGVNKYEPTFKDVAAVNITKLKKWFYHSGMCKTTIKKAWLTGSVAAFAVFAGIVAFYPMRVLPKVSNKYSIYASTPLKLGSSTYKIYSQDARSQKINMVFRKYNCPLEGMGEIFVYEADKHNIPWWLVAAVSFQESSCGKLTPEPQGIESYNAWGWAVYGDTVQSFDNWARGIETVSEYMSKKFFSKGITDPCEIMKTYTPPSKGSWCEGVKHFGDMIQDYSTPQT